MVGYCCILEHITIDLDALRGDIVRVIAVLLLLLLVLKLTVVLVTISVLFIVLTGVLFVTAHLNVALIDHHLITHFSLIFLEHLKVGTTLVRSIGASRIIVDVVEVVGLRLLSIRAPREVIIVLVSDLDAV